MNRSGPHSRLFSAFFKPYSQSAWIINAIRLSSFLLFSSSCYATHKSPEQIKSRPQFPLSLHYYYGCYGHEPHKNIILIRARLVQLLLLLLACPSRGKAPTIRPQPYIIIVIALETECTRNSNNNNNNNDNGGATHEPLSFLFSSLKRNFLFVFPMPRVELHVFHYFYYFFYLFADRAFYTYVTFYIYIFLWFSFGSVPIAEVMGRVRGRGWVGNVRK